MEPSNLLFIFSDQHNRDLLGCYGHPLVQTPNLDALAQRGTQFENAYTNCPICVPARASLATGRYVHQIGYWDNAFAYEGAIPSWHHVLREQGYRVDSIGKLHFRGLPGDDHGFSQEVEPLNVVEGVGDILGSIRRDPPIRLKRGGILEAGPGDSTYLQYDGRNADNGCQWLAEHAEDDRPWALFLSFVCPHPPYISPAELFDLYPLDEIELPPQSLQQDWPDHPVIAYFREFFDWTEPFSERELRQLAAAYMGVCTYLDRQIGRVLQQLDDLGLRDSTRVIYSSDHGEHLGARGIFGKFTLYEESAAVPLIVAGPDVPAGRSVATPVSLVDCFPTILEAVGVAQPPEAADLPGESLWSIANAPDRERDVLCEYHALGTEHGMFMLRDRRYKYIYYVAQPAQLFDLQNDPHELENLADSPDHRAVLESMDARLRSLLDPEAVDRQARADQEAKVAAFGGREAVIERGAFDNSPTPGEEPAFRSHRSH